MSLVIRNVRFVRSDDDFVSSSWIRYLDQALGPLSKNIMYSYISFRVHLKWVGSDFLPINKKVQLIAYAIRWFFVGNGLNRLRRILSCISLFVYRFPIIWRFKIQHVVVQYVKTIFFYSRIKILMFIGWCSRQKRQFMWFHLRTLPRCQSGTSIHILFIFFAYRPSRFLAFRFAFARSHSTYRGWCETVYIISYLLILMHKFETSNTTRVSFPTKIRLIRAAQLFDE